jgi:hypothetical protein
VRRRAKRQRGTIGSRVNPEDVVTSERSGALKGPRVLVEVEHRHAIEFVFMVMGHAGGHIAGEMG